MASRTAPYPGTQSVARALGVLNFFTDQRPRLTLAEVTRLAKLSKPTAYRLLTALEKAGLLTRSGAEPSEAYQLGPEAIALGWRALRANSLHSASHAELEALAQATGDTASLEVLRNGEALILDEVHGHHLLGSVQSTGTRWPVHATSTGKVLLAYLPADERAERLKSALPRLTPNTITSAAALRRELGRIREQGYATAIEELEIGLTAIGAPVYNHKGEVVAAVSVSGPSHRLMGDEIPELAGRVKKAGERISRRLGYRP